MKHDFFKNIFFPSTIIEWNKIDWKIKDSEIFETFKKILSFIRPSLNSTFNCHNPEGIKPLTTKVGLNSSWRTQFSRFQVVEKVKFKLVLNTYSTIPTIWKKDWPS